LKKLYFYFSKLIEDKLFLQRPERVWKRCFTKQGGEEEEEGQIHR